MNKSIDNTLTLEQFKKIVQSKFNEYKKQGYKLGQAYELEAKKYGFKTWRDMRIFLENKEKLKDE